MDKFQNEIGKPQKRRNVFVRKASEIPGGPHLMWTIKEQQKYYSDGSVVRTYKYEINPSFVGMLRKQFHRFTVDSKLSDIFEDFNTEILGNTRIGSLIKELSNPKKDGIITVKDLQSSGTTVEELKKRPNISLHIVIKFKLMLEFYGFKEIFE